MLQLLGDLFETEPRHVPQVQHLLIGLGEVRNSRPEGLGHVGIDLLVPGPVLPPGFGHRTQNLPRHGNRLPLPPPHFIPQPIHGDSKNPRLELALLHVVLEFGGHGAETGLRDLLSEVVIVAIGHQQRMHSRGVFGHDRPPGCIVAGNGLLDQRLGVF